MIEKRNAIDFLKNDPRASQVDLVIADPPYGESDLINETISLLHLKTRGPIYMFMYAEDLWTLEASPAQVLFWVKPVSTKNTIKAYSRFVEVIAAYQVRNLNQKMHWSNRTGLFTDHLQEKPEHPHGKPPSLIERLIRNHWKPNLVLDPFAGSGTVGAVSERLGVNHISLDVNTGE